MNTDITYCFNPDCPFKNCERHFSKLEGKTGIASFANFGGVCREYLNHLLEGVEDVR